MTDPTHHPKQHPDPISVFHNSPNGETDRTTDRKTDRQMDRQTDRQTDQQMG